MRGTSGEGWRKTGGIGGRPRARRVAYPRRAASEVDYLEEGDRVILDLKLDVRGDNRMYLPVSIYSKLYYGLLDCGATVSVIGKKGWEKLQKLNVPLLPSHIFAVKVADGKQCRVLGVVEIPLEIENQVRLCTFLVVPDIVQEVILGIDLWKLFGMVPNVVTGRCELLNNLPKFDVAELAVSEEELVEIPVPSLEYIMSTNRPVRITPRQFICQGQEGGYGLGSILSVSPGGVEEKIVNSAANLPKAQLKELKSIIDRFRPTVGRDQLGCTHLFKHGINTGDAPPVRQRYYPYSPKMLDVLHSGLEEWLKQGVVEPSRSPWASPVLLIKKKDGSYRWVVDLRQVNRLTKSDAYPLPRVNSILDQLRDARFMSSIDLSSAYFQIPLEESSKEKTAFIVPGKGLYQFTRMPQGLVTSAATWQRFIDSVIGEDLKPYVFVYLDDIILISKDFDHHMKLLEAVLSRLEAANLTVNLAKCHFCRSELKYLGYVVNEHGLQVDPEKVRAIAEFRRPQDPKGVKRFVGMASWYRRFIMNFATVMAPLHRLTAKNVKFRWTDESEEAFVTIKEKLMTAPVLTCPDFSKPFDVYCDASGYGLGAVLAQEDQPVAYASRSLLKHERKYTTTELECLAVVWAVQHFRGYLEGYKFRVITDHASLLWLHNLKEPCGRLGRWCLKLQQYDFEIFHRKGKEHEAPDALSREPLHFDGGSIDLIVVEGQAEDQWYTGLKEEVSSQPDSYPSWRIEEGQLLKLITGPEGTPVWAIVVPKELRNKVLDECHDSVLAAHGGVNKTLDRVRRRYYWPQMRREVRNYVAACKVCMGHKVPPYRPAGLFGKAIQIDRPMQVLATDFQGPFPRSKQGYKYLAVTVCLFSKYVWVRPLRKANQEEIAKHLEQDVFLKYGPPACILCDNGTQYASKRFQTMCNSYGIEIRYNFYYHAQVNPAERYNRVIKTMMRSYIKDDHREWDQNLSFVCHAINTSRHEVTGFTPHKIMFQEEWVESGKLKGVRFKGSEIPDFADRNKALKDDATRQKLRILVQDRLKQAYKKNEKYYNLRRRPVTYLPGQQVYRKNFVQSKQVENFAEKLAPKYIGPFTVVKQVGYRGYLLKDAKGHTDGPWHVEHLKGFAEVVWLGLERGDVMSTPFLSVCSWNVAGFRAALRKGAGGFLDRQNFDLVCLQETKCSKVQIAKWAESSGYHSAWHASSNHGYAGVAILSKVQPLQISFGPFGDKSEARVISAFFESFTVVNVYAPYAGENLQNLEKRLKWQKELVQYLLSLKKDKPVLLVGDMNVAFGSQDLAAKEYGPKIAGCTELERKGMQDIFSLGFFDSFRSLNPNKVQYSFWRYGRGNRKRNNAMVGD